MESGALGAEPLDILDRGLGHTRSPLKSSCFGPALRGVTARASLGLRYAKWEDFSDEYFVGLQP